MKKQIKPASPAGRKLSLNKSTISNLSNADMNQLVGGNKTKGKNCGGGGGATSEVTMQGCGSIYRTVNRTK